MEQRLQKLIAAAGIASRRHAEQLIVAGRVTVNGEVVKELGTKADPDKDHIKVNGKLINPQLQSREKVYVLLNKPKGYLSSVSDPEGRPVVTELLPP
jgi:23S rRNA pseudouridine2605 synthase